MDPDTDRPCQYTTVSGRRGAPRSSPAGRFPGVAGGDPPTPDSASRAPRRRPCLSALHHALCFTCTAAASCRGLSTRITDSDPRTGSAGAGGRRPPVAAFFLALLLAVDASLALLWPVHGGSAGFCSSGGRRDLRNAPGWGRCGGRPVAAFLWRRCSPLPAPLLFSGQFTSDLQGAGAVEDCGIHDTRVAGGRGWLLGGRARFFALSADPGLVALLSTRCPCPSRRLGS